MLNLFSSAKARLWPFVVLWLWLLAALAIGQLNARDLWYDEIYTIYHTGGPPFGPYSLIQMWDLVAKGVEWTPVGYNLLLNVWTAAVGWSPFAARYFSFLASLLAAAWVYRLGVDTGSRQVGLWAALLLGGAFFIYYMGELRAYSLYLCFTAQLLVGYWRYIHRANWGNGFIFFSGALGLMYTHYFGLLVLAALGLYHMLFVPKRRVWWLVGGIVALAVLLYLPWLNAALVVLGEAQKGDWSGGAMDAPLAIETLLTAFSNDASGLAVLLFIGAFLSGRRGARFALFMSAMVLVLALLVNAWLLVLNHVRYIYALWVLLAVVGGWGIHYWSQRGVKGRWLAGVWLAFGLWQYASGDFVAGLHGSFRPLPHRQVVAAIAPYATTADLIVYHAPYFPHIRTLEFDYYLRDLEARHALLDPLPAYPDPQNPNRAYAALLGPSQRVWLVVDHTQPQRHYLRDLLRLLRRDFFHCATFFDTPLLRLDLFARQPRAWSLHYQKDIRAALLGRIPPRVGTQLGVTLGWRLPPAFPPDTYSVSIQINNTSGDMVAQKDFALPHSESACTPVQLSLAGLPSGNYSAQLIVYNWRTLERLYAHDSTRRLWGTVMPLGEFVIETADAS